MILPAIGTLILFLTFLRFAVALVNMFTRPYLPGNDGKCGHLPSLSVMIPVRNEGKNIGNLLGSLTPLPYDDAEIIVFDDGSTDNTAAIIKDYALDDSRIRYLKGSDSRKAGQEKTMHAIFCQMKQRVNTCCILMLTSPLAVISCGVPFITL